MLKDQHIAKIIIEKSNAWSFRKKHQPTDVLEFFIRIKNCFIIILVFVNLKITI